MHETVRTYIQKYGVHLVFVCAVVACLIWIYSGLTKDAQTDEVVANMDHRTQISSGTVEENMPTPDRTVVDQDAAVRGYLNAAQTLAEVYKFQNGGSYGGLCEGSDRLYTLEGESGGILKYIKMVGATEVFCSTSDSAYLVEAKMPVNGHFYCVDNLNNPVEQAATREGFTSCR